MKALVISRLGGPEVLEIQEVPVPQPAPGQDLVRVDAGGLNFADVMTLSGGYPGAPKPPLVAGREFCGVRESDGQWVQGRFELFRNYDEYGDRMARPRTLLIDSEQLESGDALDKEFRTMAADEIERKGGRVLRVQLDYELKENLYRKLGKAQARHDGHLQRQKTEFARELHLPVVQGKVSFPDLRIEYATQELEVARVDLELATSHYHAGHLSEKARAGFQIYARPEDTAGLRRVRDEREITIAILSL